MRLFAEIVGWIVIAVLIFVAGLNLIWFFWWNHK